MRTLAILLLLLSTSCGYSLQTSKNPLLEEYGITRLYVAPIENDTYRAGIENVVFNALVKTIGHHQRVKIVNSEENADAVLFGAVQGAIIQPHNSTTANLIKPLATGPSDVLVTSIYGAQLTCAFELKQIHPGRGSKTIWSSSFQRQQKFSANTQLGVLGTTSALINDSEFHRAIGDLADSMMEDVHESMLAMF